MTWQQNPSFLEHKPLQRAWDSTSINAMAKCPRYYQLTIVDGWQSPLTSCHLIFGLAYHSATEHYDHARARGETHEQGVRAAIRQALIMTWDSKLNRPWVSEDKNKNRLSLIRTLVAYFDKFEHDPIETVILSNGKPAVELSFKLELDISPKGESPYLLCGHLDRIGKMEDQFVITDKKTTKKTLNDYYFQTYTPDHQFSTYSFAGRIIFPSPISGIIVDAAQILVDDVNFVRGFVGRSPEQLEEWYRDLGVILKTAEGYADEQYWPMNPRACFLCEFRAICSKAPSQREAFMARGLTKRIWNPLKARGDI